MAETEDDENLWRLVREIILRRVSRVVPELEKSQRVTRV
jgi:hypothetical protein